VLIRPAPPAYRPMLEPGLEIDDERFASLLADGAALLGGSPAHRLLDQIKLGDALASFDRGSGIATVWLAAQTRMVSVVGFAP
jgi:hypothetical protein